MHLIINEEEYDFPQGLTYAAIADQVQDKYPYQIILAVHNGVLHELTHKAMEDGDLQFLTMEDESGMRTYHRSVLFMFLKALYNEAEGKIRDVWVHFSVRKGLLIEIDGDVTVDEELAATVKARMQNYVDRDIKIDKRNVQIKDIKDVFASYGMEEKVELFRYRRTNRVNVYNMGHFEDYFYGYMAPSTGCLKWFDLCTWNGYMILMLPSKTDPRTIPPFEVQEKFYGAMLRSVAWRRMMGIESVADLNASIVDGTIQDLILVQEALQEKRLAEIAQEIADRKTVKFIMIAGPSSSGKTTTSRRLSVQLRACGLKPHAISVDNYFVERDETPLDANGEKDYECLGALDLKLFNQQMTDLLAGRCVEIPRFNFSKGCKEYKGDYMQLGPDDVLVIEGLHALNDAMSYQMPKESKFKIYLSAITQLNVDEHNRVPTTDGRLIRRMVRDARTRGTSAKDTISRWNSIRRGEESNIFPYQEDADVVFDSSLIYEMAVLKCMAEPLLFQIPQDTPEGLEARRLLKFLEYFLPIGTDQIPINSIVREFAGGSCFDV